MRVSIEEIRKRNNELDKKLSKQNDEIMTDIVVYIRGSNISEYEIETIRQDLLDMFLEAQSRNEPISSVVGEDYKSFCDDIIKNAKPKSLKHRLLEAVHIFLNTIIVLFIIDIGTCGYLSNVIYYIHKRLPVSAYYPVSAGLVVEILIIPIITYFFVRVLLKNSFKMSQLRSKKQRRKANLIIFGMFICSGALLGILTYGLGKIVLFSINVFIILAILILMHFTIKFIAKYIGTME